jgi:hypothetical protein
MSVRLSSAALAALALGLSGAAAAQVADPVVFQFSTVGDTRGAIGTPSLTAAPGTPLFQQDSVWAMNTKAFARILRTVQAQKSNMMFVNGDLILGYGDALVPTASNATVGLTVADVAGSDLMAFYKQYGFWRGMVANMMETGTYMVPVPGNHETQWNHKVAGVTTKTAMVENENAWRANMTDLILDQSRLGTMFSDWSSAASSFSQYVVNPAAVPPVLPATANINGQSYTDQITTDQSGLTYSFDFRGIHFAIINTDATGWDTHAPIAWLANDLSAAQARGAKQFFVFGHKPAYTYDYSVNMPAGTAAVTGAGLDAATDTTLCGTATCSRDLFWSLIETYRATYFSGHEHTYNSVQPTKATGGSAWQFLVGGGGSAFDPPATDTKASDRMYSWSTVQVRQSGAITVTSYGFGPTFGPTTVIDQVKVQ